MRVYADIKAAVALITSQGWCEERQRLRTDTVWEFIRINDAFVICIGIGYACILIIRSIIA